MIKKNEFRKYEFEIVPFDFKCCVYYGKDIRGAIEKFNLDKKTEEDLSDFYTARAVFFPTNGYEYNIIISESGNTPGTIAHECNHMLNSIFETIGYIPTLDNDEMQSYFLGWFVDTVHDFINKK